MSKKSTAVTETAVVEIAQISVDMRSRESIFEGINALVKVNEPEAAAALLAESEKLYEEGVNISAVLVMDVSGSMDGADQIQRIQNTLPEMLSPTVGEIPWQVRAALICFGDLFSRDQVSVFDFRPLEKLAKMRWPRESGGSPQYESHLEALMLAVGINLLLEGELRPGSERLSPLPESGVELILVTDDEKPRQKDSCGRTTLKEARRNLPRSCRLTVVASSRGTWEGLLREGDRFVHLDGNLSGLLRPVQDAISSAVVTQATKVVGLIAANIQSEVAGYLAAPITT